MGHKDVSAPVQQTYLSCSAKCVAIPIIAVHSMVARQLVINRVVGLNDHSVYEA